METPYHAGELAVQSQAGVQAEAANLGNIIGATIKPAAKDFLQNQRFAIAATIDSNNVCASLLTGKPGFIQVSGDHIVNIQATIPGEALQVGLLVIDFATRRRLRINGKATRKSDDSTDIATQQVYFNCPKYIQRRHLVADDTQLPTASVQDFDSLTVKQQQWITSADTFFIASMHPESGADTSHRGGYPGFIQVVHKNLLVFPDYAGNNMFNTLGNIALHPNSGLLFIDFERGNTLQLTGEASIVWEKERLVKFQIERVRETANATNLRWQFEEYSPFNPVL
jgi:predicted pyridoxine 5'-phosphate oxidase superfamily flavin-nucleotide-binding protein